MSDERVYEWTVRIVRTEAGCRVVLVRWLADDGGTLPAHSVQTADELRVFLRSVQAHRDDIDEAIDAFERGETTFSLQRVIMTDKQIQALRP